MHYVGFICHFLYLIIFSIYIFRVYCYEDLDNRVVYLLPMMVLIAYPMIYDSTQLWVQGFWSYISDMWNWFD